MQDWMLASGLIERTYLEDGATVRIGGERVADLDRAAGVEPFGNLAKVERSCCAAELPRAEAAQAGENQGKAGRLRRQRIRRVLRIRPHRGCGAQTRNAPEAEIKRAGVGLGLRGSLRNRGL
jgi:hypothetical protein